MCADMKDDRDVGMIQGTRGLRLLLKPSQPFAIFGKGGGQNLNRHVATEFRIARTINFAHSALADFGNNRGLSERCVWENGFAQIMRDPAVTLALCVSEKGTRKISLSSVLSTIAHSEFLHR